MNNLAKILLLGGVGYLIYKYYYLPNTKSQEVEPIIPPQDIDDDRTTFYGKNKGEYVRGFSMPDKITDIKTNVIDIITKPNEMVFNQIGRTGFRVFLNKDANRVIYNSGNTEQTKYSADYNAIKDKIVMNKDYTI